MTAAFSILFTSFVMAAVLAGVAYHYKPGVEGFFLALAVCSVVQLVGFLMWRRALPTVTADMTELALEAISAIYASVFMVAVAMGVSVYYSERKDFTSGIKGMLLGFLIGIASLFLSAGTLALILPKPDKDHLKSALMYSGY